MKKESYLKRNKLKLIILISLLLILLFFTFIGSEIFLRKKLPLRYTELVEKYSEEYGLDKYLVYAIISAESGFDASAHSDAGAYGLMQIMPETAEWLSQKYSIENGELTEPEINLRFGCCYISDLLKRFGTVELALAAYNGGEGNVRSWQKKYSSNGRDLDVIPYKETAEYVKRVTVRYEIYKELYN